MHPQISLAWLAAALAAFSGPLPANAVEHPQLLDFLAGQGCAIGPATRRAAIAEGFTEGEIDALATTAADLPGAVRTGDWLLLAPDSCTIRPPVIESQLRINDPDVRPFFSARDAYAAEGDPGCFLNAEIVQALQASRGWDADTANAEYLRLTAKSLISKEVAFYSDSPLRTPMGFMLTTGDCADVPLMPDIRHSQDFLIANFDPLLRATFAESRCEDVTAWLSSDPNTVPGIAPGTPSKNAWTSLEIMVIAFGAGWYEGMSSTEKGVPRPPICHYGDAP